MLSYYYYTIDGETFIIGITKEEKAVLVKVVPRVLSFMEVSDILHTLVPIHHA